MTAGNGRGRLCAWLTAAVLLATAVWAVAFSLRHPEPPTGGGVQAVEWAAVQGVETALPCDVPVEPGGGVRVELTLPAAFAQARSVCIRSTQQTVEAYLDGRRIYAYPAEEPALTKAPPSHWNLIDLPAESGGRTLTLVLASPYREFSGRVNRLLWGSRGGLEAYLTGRSLPNLVISFLLLAGGVLLLLYHQMTRRLLPNGVNAHLGVCLLLFALWSLTECQSPSVFVGTETLNTLLSFLTVMLFPLPYLLYVRNMVSARFFRWTDGLFFAGLALFLGGVGLQLAGVVDLVEARAVFYGFLLVTLLCSAVLLWLEHHRRDGMVKLQLAGVGIFLGFVLIDLYAEYCTNLFLVSGMFSRIGITLFVLSLALMAQRLRVGELCRSVEAEKQAALMERQIAFAAEQIRQMNDSIAQTRQYRHDMRHQLLLLEGLAERGENAQLSAHLNMLAGSLEVPIAQRCCKNELLDIVLTFYFDRARKLDAAVTHTIRLPENLPVPDADLSVILANALENALHALAEAARPRRLSVSLFADGQRLALEVKNSSQPVVIDGDGLPLRADGERGIGTQSILRIVERLHGACDYTYSPDDGTFVFRAVIHTSGQ